MWVDERLRIWYPEPGGDVGTVFRRRNQRQGIDDTLVIGVDLPGTGDCIGALSAIQILVVEKPA